MKSVTQTCFKHLRKTKQLWGDNDLTFSTSTCIAFSVVLEKKKTIFLWKLHINMKHSDIQILRLQKVELSVCSKHFENNSISVSYFDGFLDLKT